jgi:hypothetical protein
MAKIALFSVLSMLEVHFDSMRPVRDSRLLPLVRDYLAAPISRMSPLSRVLVRLVSGTLVNPLRGVEFTSRASSALRVLDERLAGNAHADQ